MISSEMLLGQAPEYGCIRDDLGIQYHILQQTPTSRNFPNTFIANNVL